MGGMDLDRVQPQALDAEGATVCQPFAASGAICWPPSQGFSVEALRPAWPSWIATGMSDQARMPFSTRAIAASVASS